MSFPKNLLSAILCLICLSSCSDFANTLVGAPPKTDPPPTGEFVGTWTKMDSKIVTAANGSSASSATTTATTNGQAAANIVPDANGGEVKVTLFPNDEGSIDGTGIMTFGNNSQRFFWRSNGGGKEKIWSVNFAKDNNLYTDITRGFQYIGTIKSSDASDDFEGSLKVLVAEVETEYLVKAYKFHMPEVIVGKDAPTAKAGEKLTIECNHSGYDASKIMLYLTNKKDQTKLELVPERIEKGSAGKDGKISPNKLILTLDKAAVKGEYDVFLKRDAKFESNSFTVIIQ